MKVDRNVLLSALSEYNVRTVEKGTIADCPVCNNEEENKGAGKLLITPDGILSCMRFAGHSDEMRREHRSMILETIGVNEIAVFKDYEIDDNHVLRVSKNTNRSKNQIVLMESGNVVAVDTVQIDKESDRKRFVKNLTIGGNLKENIESTLMRLAGEVVSNAITDIDEPRRAYEGFFVLGDGRVAEMTQSGFAVYNPNSQETELKQVIEFDGTTYIMPRDPIFFKANDEGILLPPNVTEYKNDAELMQVIEGFISKYIDMPPLDIKLAAAYTKFTYIADKTFELPYLRIVGATGSQSRGSGKSKLAGVLGRICYRPFKVTSPSASSTFRTMDKYHPTLVIDEFNMSGGSEDTQAMMQILNSGHMRGNLITRTERNEETGEMVVNGYSPYGAKIIGGLTLTDSQAFESRAIRIEMQKTSRRDIEYRTSIRQRNEAAKLRSMLTLWRLRNWNTFDVEVELDTAEEALKQYEIEPRYIQIATPLYAVLNDEALREELALMLVERTEDDAQERKLTTEGYLVTIIHSMIFEQNDDAIVWTDKPLCVEDEPCELLVIKDITNKLNLINPEEKAVSAATVGKKLSKMMLRTHSIDKRGTTNWKKSAVIFNLRNLVYQFKQYALPLPEDIRNDIPGYIEKVQIITGKTGNRNTGIYPSNPGPVEEFPAMNTGEHTTMEIPLEAKKILKDFNKEVTDAWNAIEEAPNPLNPLNDMSKAAQDRLKQLVASDNSKGVDLFFTKYGRVNVSLRDLTLKYLAEDQKVLKKESMPRQDKKAQKSHPNIPFKTNNLHVLTGARICPGQSPVSKIDVKKHKILDTAKKVPAHIVVAHKLTGVTGVKSQDDTPKINAHTWKKGLFKK